MFELWNSKGMRCVTRNIIWYDTKYQEQYTFGDIRKCVKQILGDSKYLLFQYRYDGSSDDYVQ